ncbi:MAG: helix-turn-helix domain-containing protein [Polyangiaceae bacterium]|nr:helix-turn-helix domain-containing protein [Polyangiaceae bacterium]
MTVRFHHQALVRARVELGLTQEQAAHALGVDVRTYRRYESGEVNDPDGFALNRASRRKILRKMARELGLAETDLVVDTSLAPMRVGAAEKPDPASPRLDEIGHVLPRAAHFVGRRALLDKLARWAGAPDVDDVRAPRIIAVIGIGGAGKTSLVERFLTSRPPALVWTFYEDPRADSFFDAVVSAFDTTERTGRGALLDRATATLASPSPKLLVLDGLEAMQSSGNDGRARGELDDSRLRLLLRRIVRGLGKCRALITSRFPLEDLTAWEGDGFETVPLDALSRAEAADAFAQWGVRGSGRSLSPLQDAADGHALTVGVIGSYVSRVLGGDSSRFEAFDLADAARDTALARRLDKILRDYSDNLGAVDRDVLCRVCAFPRGASLDDLVNMASGSDVVAGSLSGQSRSSLEMAVRRLEAAGLLFSDAHGDRASAHPFVRAHFQAMLGGAHSALHEAERVRLAARLDARPNEPPSSAAELDALEALFEHTLFAGHVEQAFELYMQRFFGFRHLGLELGELARGLRLVRAFAEPPHGAGAGDPLGLSDRLPPGIRARLAYEWGLYASAGGDLPTAIRCYERQNDMADRWNDGAAKLTGLRTLAYTHRLRDELDTAVAHVQASIRMARELDYVAGLARGHALYGALLTDTGAFARARDQFEEARALGDHPVARRGLWEAELAVGMGELDRAQTETAENLRICEDLRWTGHAAQCNLLLGRIALLRGGSADGAVPHLESAKAWCRQSGEVETVLQALDLEASIARRLGRKDHARTLETKRDELAEPGGFRRPRT